MVRFCISRQTNKRIQDAQLYNQASQLLVCSALQCSRAPAVQLANCSVSQAGGRQQAAGSRRQSTGQQATQIKSIKNNKKMPAVKSK